MFRQKNQKTIAITAILLQFLFWIPASEAQENQEDIKEKKQFLVTAYYSPQPDQSFYIRGSYEADMELNGQGTHGADGTEVYIGMVAAPANYDFGTKVYIPGLGVGEVHDRGGAILPGADYDRLDIWMGYGEEGLARALNWGSRLVEGEIYFDPAQVSSALDLSWLKTDLPESIVKNLQTNADDISFKEVINKPETQFKTIKPIKSRLEEINLSMASDLGRGAEGEAVEKLQNLLQELGYFQTNLNGKYDQSTIEAVYRLQLQAGIVQSEADLGAGYFGQKTKQALLSALDKKVSPLKTVAQEVKPYIPPKQPLPALESLSIPQVLFTQKILAFDEVLSNKKIVQVDLQETTPEPKLNDKSVQVQRLQEKLITEGYLVAGLNTGYFGPKTLEALRQFQLEEGIIEDYSDPNAGKVEAKTLTALHLS